MKSFLDNLHRFLAISHLFTDAHVVAYIPKELDHSFTILKTCKGTRACALNHSRFATTCVYFELLGLSTNDTFILNFLSIVLKSITWFEFSILILLFNVNINLILNHKMEIYVNKIIKENMNYENISVTYKIMISSFMIDNIV